MTGWLAKLAEFLGRFFGRLLAALLPAIGREIRKNNTVEQKGNDHETKDTLDSDIWDAARRNPPRR